VPLTLTVGPRVHRTLLADPDRWTQQLRAVSLDAAGDELWLARVKLACAAPAAGSAASFAVPGVGPAAIDPEGPLGQIARLAAELRADDAAVAALAEELGDLRAKLPAEVKEGGDGLRLDEPAVLRRLLDEAEALVLGRLAGAGGEGEAA
jgi:hypothetical protein